jgi:PAS domain S-box-containing protein
MAKSQQNKTKTELLKEIKDLKRINKELEKFAEKIEKDKKSLLEKEKNYRHLIESSRDAVYVIQNKRLVWVNPAWENLFGYTAKEVTSKTFDINKIIAPKSRKKIKDKFDSADTFSSQDDSHYEMQGLTKSGKTLDIEVTVTLIEWKSKPAFQGIYRDITEQKKTHEALRREGFIFENLYDALIITDMEGYILNWNHAAERMYGYTKSEVLNKSSDILNDRNMPIPMSKKIISELGEKEKWKGEINFIRKDGSKGISETVVFPYLDKNGEKIAFVGVNRDITERKKAENDLKESEDKFRKITENSLVGFYLIQDEIFKYVNPKAAQMFGYKIEDVIFKKGFKDVVAPASIPVVEKNIEKRLSGEMESIHYEFQGITKNGILKDFEVFGTTAFYLGRPAILGTILDITDRKKSEVELLKLSQAVEQSPNSIIITNIDGNIEYVNPWFSKLTGYQKEEVINKNPRLLKSGHTSPEEYKKLWETVTSGKIWRGEILNRKKSGEFFWLSVSICPIIKQGKITHYVAIQEDISEKKKIEHELITAKEKAEESDKLKSAFLAQMSHEIRSPLNVILSYNSFLRDELTDKLDNDLVSSFSYIESAGHRLLRTIDMILSMAAIQSGYFDIKMEKINLPHILISLVKEFEQIAAQKDVKISFNPQTDKTIVEGDGYIITEIFQNLVGNAVKYTPHGSIEVNLYEDKESKVCVAIKDTGIGISKEYLPRLFDPFSQEDSGYSRKFEGNGLGLALVKNYTELIKADIEVDSVKGKGTTFTVIFNDHHNQN